MLIVQFQWGCMMLAVQLHLTGRCIGVAIISNDAPFFAAMSFPSITIAVPPPPPTPTQPSANHRRRPVILEEHLDQNLSSALLCLIKAMKRKSGHLNCFGIKHPRQLKYFTFKKIMKNPQEQNKQMCER